MVDLNEAMYKVLVVGMVLSTLTYVLGLVLFFIQNAAPLEATVLHYSSLIDFAQQLVLLRSSAVLMLATIILLATPMVRVVISVAVFAANHDPRFVAVTAIVFAILMASIMLGYIGQFAPS